MKKVEKQKKITELKRQIQMLENNSTYGAYPKEDDLPIKDSKRILQPSKRKPHNRRT
jgi:hypothetical protein